MAIRFDRYDRKDWETFRASKKTSLSGEEFEMVCELHSKYYKHKFHKPCTCSPKITNKWIKELNIIWDKGFD
tara:strand:- start:420 stop:635 length:216 start_codon:yes stop_codon:yes gene_type:complete